MLLASLLDLIGHAKIYRQKTGKRLNINGSTGMFSKAFRVPSSGEESVVINTETANFFLMTNIGHPSHYHGFGGTAVDRMPEEIKMRLDMAWTVMARHFNCLRDANTSVVYMLNMTAPLICQELRDIKWQIMFVSLIFQLFLLLPSKSHN